MTGPSGNYGGWKATAIGANSKSTVACLRQEYREGMTLAEAQLLALKAVAKSLDTANISAEKLEMMTLTRDTQRRSGRETVQRVLTQEELRRMIEENRELLTRRDADDDEEDEDEQR